MYVLVGKCIVLCLVARIVCERRGGFGRGVVVDLRFLKVKEDRKSRVFCSSFISFPRHPNRGLDFFVFVM